MQRIVEGTEKPVVGIFVAERRGRHSTHEGRLCNFITIVRNPALKTSHYLWQDEFEESQPI